MDPIYVVWRRVRSPFLLPEACHRCRMDDWEVFDIDKAGCSVCGRFHQCKDGGDCVGVADSDHQACEITGCWIRTRNFQQGYTDTAMPMGVDAPAAKQWVERDHVLRWLHTLVGQAVHLAGDPAPRRQGLGRVRAGRKVVQARGQEP